METYYASHRGTLERLFGTKELLIESQSLTVNGKRFDIVDDVIVLISTQKSSPTFAKDIQFTFGQEWQSYAQILPEHEVEFNQYFDLIDLKGLRTSTVCDLGCGNGRWSYFLQPHCNALILVDFSEAVFVARRNLREKTNCLFFQGDIKQLPFASDCADLIFSMGVLHHLPTPCLDEVRALKRYAPKLLIFLYYALDNRPIYFRWILTLVTGLRLLLCRVQNEKLRRVIAVAGTWGLYLPLITLGRILKPLGLQSKVPLYDAYHTMSHERIEQDVYDRFFTRIEQRVSREEIKTLTDTFQKVTISEQLPYWHFLCEK